MKYAYTFDDLQIVPAYSDVESRSKCSLFARVTKNYRAQLPYIASPMDTVTEAEMAAEIGILGGLGVIHRFMSIDRQVSMVLQVKQHTNLVAAAIGVSGDFMERAKALVAAGANILLIDVAHGNTHLMKTALEWCSRSLPGYVDVIAGNVATHEGARNLAEWGAAAIRVGIGGGSLCETRIRTGVGIPQVTSIIECLRGIEESGIDVPIIADGGIRTPGDVAKALSIGADTVMLGSLFAGTTETPGEITRVGTWPNEQLFKKYRGSASLETKMTHSMPDRNVEGNSKLIPYKGRVKRIVDDLNDGVRSAMSYVGAYDLKTFRIRSEHVIVTQNGLVEAKPHLLL